MGEFMEAYSIKEVSKLVDVPQGTLRQWEKDFTNLLIIPRDAQNARYYTEFEINTLKHIKSMRDKNLSKKIIKELLQKQSKRNEEEKPVISPSVPMLKQNEAIETLRNIQRSFEAFPEIKDMIISELKSEIRNEIKDELTVAVRKEITSNLELSNKQAAEQTETLSKALEKMESSYKKELERRDQILLENMRLMNEIKKEKNTSILKRIFARKEK